LSPLSIPVFAELPLDMSVVAGAITLKQQNLVSHIQLKSRARHTPNLDISELEGGLKNPLFNSYPDGTWVHMVLVSDTQVKLEPATEAQALAAYDKKKTAVIKLNADVTTSTIFRTEDLSSADYIRVGSKAANYAELAKVLNSATRNVVRPGFGIPFYYYDEYIRTNPKIKAAIDSILKDPLMNKVAKVSYRETKLKNLQNLMLSEDTVINDQLLNDLISRFDQFRDSKGLPRKLKLRSSTNSEDLPNFNGAGLYTSDSYKPVKNGIEKTQEEKKQTLKKTLRVVWSSIWNLRAFDERAFFQIPHGDVKMGMQVNLAFSDQGAEGVVVTKNIANDPRFPGNAVYVETQRGNKYSVTNPTAGVKPQKILVFFNEQNPVDVQAYKIVILQNSNVADDFESLLPTDNPIPVLSNEEIKDLVYQSLKAHVHFGPVLDPGNKNFSLDIEFKVDTFDTGSRQIYMKQTRPYLD
jgi:phosphoenolpyruvate synthase/pyruvate phosphate dikinase